MVALYLDFRIFFLSLCPSLILDSALYCPTIFNFVEFKLAMIQMAVGASKPENIAKAVKFITEASSAGANIVTLPVSLFDIIYSFSAILGVF